ncbi:MAG: leucine-rich repeat protein [Oscillospiraceae bacterium]|nr:leucine-rich repeat protein [Oscillospiraceae bacterium]
MKFKKLTAVLLSAATLASMPFTPVLKDCVQDTVLTAEATTISDSIIAYINDNSVMFAICQRTNGTRYAVALASYMNIQTASIGATVPYNGQNIPVTEIGDYVFANKESLTKVNLSNAKNLTKIGQNAFSGSPITEVTIGGMQSLTIAPNAFSSTESLQTFTVKSTAKSVTLEGDSFWRSNVKKLDFSCSKITIKQNAFSYCYNVNQIRFSKTVSQITLGELALSYLRMLNSLTVENRSAKMTLGKGAFSGSVMTGFNLPTTVTTIPEECFDCCSDLSSLTLPDSLKTICANAFRRADLPSNLKIGKNVTSIADSAFNYISGTKTIQVDSANTKYKAVDNVLFTKDGTKLLCYPPEKLDYAYTFYAKYIPNGTINNAYLAQIILKNYVRQGTDPTDFGFMPSLTSLIIPTAELNRSTTGYEVLRDYLPMLNRTKVRSINSIMLVDTPSGSEPRINSRFSEGVRLHFEDYETCYFMKEYVDKMAAYVVNSVTTTGMSDYQKAVRLHQWICERTSYDPDEEEYVRIKDSGGKPDPSLKTQKNHVTASVFLHSKNASDLKHTYTVCEGYAKCYELLMKKAGVETYYVTGENVKIGKSGHAWNLVKIRNKYYHVDVCWDDGNLDDGHPNDRYEHFLCTDSQFASDGHESFRWYVEGNRSLSIGKNVATHDIHMIGDTNNDSAYTIADRDALQNHLNGTKPITNSRMLNNADVDLNGTVNSNDLSMLATYLSTFKYGYRSPFFWRMVCYEK